MPLIEPERTNETKEAWRVRLYESVTAEILAYCEWAGIRYKDTFIQKACLHVFNEDKEWQAYKRSNPVATPPKPDKA